MKIKIKTEELDDAPFVRCSEHVSLVLVASDLLGRVSSEKTGEEVDESERTPRVDLEVLWWGVLQSKPKRRKRSDAAGLHWEVKNARSLTVSRDEKLVEVDLSMPRQAWYSRRIRLTLHLDGESADAEIIVLPPMNVWAARVFGTLALVLWGLAAVLFTPSWTASGVGPIFVQVFGGLAAAVGVTGFSHLIASARLPKFGLYTRLRIAFTAFVCSCAVIFLPRFFLVRVWNDTSFPVELHTPDGDLVLAPKSDTLLYKTGFEDSESALVQRYGTQLCKLRLDGSSDPPAAGETFPACKDNQEASAPFSSKTVIGKVENLFGYKRTYSLKCNGQFAVLPKTTANGVVTRVELLQDDCKPIDGAANRQVSLRTATGNFHARFHGTATIHLPYDPVDNAFASLALPAVDDGDVLVWTSGSSEGPLPLQMTVSVGLKPSQMPIVSGESLAWKVMDSTQHFERGTMRVLGGSDSVNHLGVHNAELSTAETCCESNGGKKAVTSLACATDEEVVSDYTATAGQHDAWLASAVPADKTARRCKLHLHVTPIPTATTMSVRCDGCSLGDVEIHTPDGIAEFDPASDASERRLTSWPAPQCTKTWLYDPRTKKRVWQKTAETKNVWSETKPTCPGEKPASPPPSQTDYSKFTDRNQTPCTSAPRRCDGDDGTTQCDC